VKILPQTTRSSRTKRRVLIWLGALVLVGGAATALYLKQHYDVMGLLQSRYIDFLSMNTSLLVASPDEIDAQISAGKLSRLPMGDDSRNATGPLFPLPANPRYFTDGSGRAIYLTGSHTWSNFQDNGGDDPPPRFDYDQYLDFLEAHNHNFFRLWTWEGSRWTLQSRDNEYWFNPMTPFQRPGPGSALDGKPKWDLTLFDQRYFDRMRARIVAAGDRGIYVSVMLFNGWSVASLKGDSRANNPWRGHPFNEANNVNGINGDSNGDNSGEEIHELSDPGVLALQEAYVRKVIDTVNDLDNVLYEISNESHANSTEWQYHMIKVIKEYEATKPKQHPVGMTAEGPPTPPNEVLFASNADWISPGGYSNPPPADGTKVIIADTDHIWGIGGDRAWVWKSFTRGINPIFMDGYDGAGYGVGGASFQLDDPRWVSLRRNMGYARAYSLRMDLAKMTPSGDLCSTGYCLADKVGGSSYLVYAPEGGDIIVDLIAAPGPLSVEWFDPETGESMEGGTITGGSRRSFSPPREGDVVLFLHEIL